MTGLSQGINPSGIPANWYSVSDYYSQQAALSKASPKKDLDKNSFLQLLVTQLQNQDPSSPMNNQDFIAQMAQFSSLEQMNNVATGMGKVSTDNSMQAAIGLLGKSITALDANGNPVSGVVTGMKMSNGMAQLEMGTQLVDLSNVLSAKTVTTLIV